MASQGPFSPSTTVDDNSFGAIAWNSPNNAQSSNAVYATASTVGGGNSDYLSATNFGFTIPAGSRIDGILVEVQKAANIDSGGDFVVDSRVRIVLADSSIGTTDKADTSTHWPTSEAYKSYGGSADTWGLGWTETNINSANFGVVISAAPNSSNSTAKVDHIRITVYYTANGTTTSTSSSTTSSSTSSTSSSISSTSSSISSTSSSTSTSVSTSTSTTVPPSTALLHSSVIHPDLPSTKIEIYH